MYFSVSVIAALAALTAAQHSSLNRDDIPDECQRYDPCNEFLSEISQCQRDPDQPEFFNDGNFVYCMCQQKKLLRTCYVGCIAKHDSDGRPGSDFAKAYDKCLVDPNGFSTPCQGRRCGPRVAVDRFDGP